VNWYASRLLGSDVQESDAGEVILQSLLDERDMILPEELRQLRLLFGTERVVKEALKQRPMLDCRVRRTAGKRWDVRDETTQNVLESLRRAIEFFAQHAGLAGISIDGLTESTGSADYIAMREALVNLFIHQDYDDEGTAAQIELTPEQAVFFNAGKSLVGIKTLQQGGRSQSRNPLIARALRQIGFAELGGSGLRYLRETWETAGRSAPQFESNPASNSFTLTLDWRVLPQAYDEFWRTRLGVRITPDEARVLSVLAASTRMTSTQLAAALGRPMDEVSPMLEHLTVNQLVRREQDAFALPDHLRELARQTVEGA
jgi:predicted HTH transcriptional regulator